MKRKLLSLLLVIVMMCSICTPALAQVPKPNPYYAGENYHEIDYVDKYSTKYNVSEWAKSMEAAYNPTWYEKPQRQVARGEAFLVFLRTIQRSLTRQGYSKLYPGSIVAPFTDYHSVYPETQLEVDTLYANGILLGYLDNTMKFSQALTRSEMAAIYARFNRLYFNMGIGYGIWNYGGYDSYYSTNYDNYYNAYMYKDISGHWAEKDIIIASANGVLKGYGNGYFGPEDPLTVEQVWKILDSCVGYQGVRRSDVACAMSQTFKVKFDSYIDEGYKPGVSIGVKITNIDADAACVLLCKGTSATVEVDITPDNASYQKLAWFSSDPSSVSIEESWNTTPGKAYVTIRGNRDTKENVVITGYAMDGSNVTVRFNVGVVSDEKYITSAQANPWYLNLNLNQGSPVNITVYPKDATTNIVWKSDNLNIARVQVWSDNTIYIMGVGVGDTVVRGYDSVTNQEVCTIPVWVYGTYNPVLTDKSAPVVTIEGPSNVIINDTFIITVKAYDNIEVLDFNLGISSIVGMTDALEIIGIRKVSGVEYRVTLKAKEVASQSLCIEAGAAIDTAGNISKASDGMDIVVNSGE